MTDKQLRDELSEENRKIGGWNEGFDPFYGAPTLLLVLADAEDPNCRYNGALVMGNLMNAAHALGVDSIWINRAYQTFEDPQGKKLLKKWGIEGHWEGVGYCPLGYATRPLPDAAPRKPGYIVRT